MSTTRHPSVVSGLSAESGVRERLLAELPVRDERLEIGGISTAVLVGGEGPPMVLLHGAGEFAALWGQVLPDVTRTHRVIVPDLPGHGASGVPAGPLDGERVLAWLAELIEHTCPTPPVLVGHLQGGAVAARFAAGSRADVAALVLVDATGLGRFWPTPAFALALMSFVTRPGVRTQERLLRACMVDFDALQERLGEHLEGLAAYGLELALLPSASVAARNLVRDFAVTTIPRQDLEGIAAPTTLIWGRHDRQVRLSVAEAASARYGWALHVIDGAADDPAVECPQEFVTALRAALSAGVAGAPGAGWARDHEPTLIDEGPEREERSAP